MGVGFLNIEDQVRVFATSSTVSSSSTPERSLGMSDPRGPAIRVEGLTKTYQAKGKAAPVQAVRGIDLEIARGECFGLLGPNGAGKTTTIEILEGLNHPTSGTVEVLGLSWERHDQEIRRRIGVTLQETRFPEKATTLELARLFRSFYPRGLDPAEALARVALTSKASAYVETLSGGQRQRLAVALALVGDPELLFLDEPTTGLDPQSRRQLWEVIGQLRAQGRTIVLTTHYMDEAEKLCDRIAIVDHGRIIAQGSPRQLIDRLGGGHIIIFELEERSPRLEPSAFADLPGVTAVRREAEGYALTVAEPHAAIPSLLDRLADHGRVLKRLDTHQASLEDVFVALTGRHLRDDLDVASPSTNGLGSRVHSNE